MKKLLAIFLLLSQLALAQSTVQLAVHFQKGSDVPDMPQMAMLNEVADYDNAEELRFWVVGHTDSNGSTAFNRALSKRRTMAVVKHLLLSGIRPYNIIFEYKGETCAMQEYDDEQLQANNRRVDVLISNIGPLIEPGFAGVYSEATFKKPLAKVDPEPEMFVVKADESVCIEAASGTYIDIPPMAFVDAYGRPISGEVTIEYEEFIDPFSIFLSGISMKYDSAGTTHNFESAGMFSLTAKHRQKPVELRDDKPIQMDFVSTSEDADFDYFFLDPSTQAWANLGDASIRADDVALMEQMEGLSGAIVGYLERTDYLSMNYASRTTLEHHFQNMEYMQGRPIASYYRFLRKGSLKENRAFRREWKKQATFQTRLIPVEKKNEKGTIHFKVSKRSFSNSLNPEWNGFNGHLWEYNGDLSRSELKALLGRMRFHNLRIRFDASTQQVTLELKNLDSILHIPVKKIAIENVSMEYQKRMWGEFSPAYEKARLRAMNRQFDSKYRSYSRSLARQEKKIQRDADKADAKSKREYDRAIRKAWKSSKRAMTAAEKLMSLEQWVAYSEGLSDKLREYYEARQRGQSVVRSLTVDRMGIYNCDRVKELKNPDRIEPRFVLADGSVVNWVTAYVFDDDYNGVITFERTSFNGVTVDPGTLKTMIVTDTNGSTYRLNETEVIAMNKSKSASRILHLTEFDHSASSLEEVRDMLGLAQD